jgi:hypothetical protein
MTGGILQMAISGKQDIYLTIDPQITFFKKVYRRHTNFSTELIEILSEQNPSFNNEITFILNHGDAIHRCYFEITLPLYSFSDQYITNSKYLNNKDLNITNLNNTYNILNSKYNSLKGFVDVELGLYRLLYNLLQTENITLSILKEQVNVFNYKNKITKDMYKNKIDESIFYEINISGYISKLDKIITSDINFTNDFISKSQILLDINNCYNKMLFYLNYYNNNMNSIQIEINSKTQTNQINFNFAEYLGHNFFEYVKLDIGGQEFDRYTKDILHIQQMHNILPDHMDNYLDMIGHTPELIDYNNNIKGNRKILVPLIFWFNKNAGASLPLVAMQYSSIVINAKISDVTKIICFENYNSNYNDIINITIPNNGIFKLNTNLIYDSYTINESSKSISYKCSVINYELLKLKFQELKDADIILILINNGSLNEQIAVGTDNINKVINKDQWIRFLMDLTNPEYSSFIDKIASYYPYINYNLYSSSIDPPNVKLICETVFMDDIERSKFASSKLEYVIERFDSDIYTIKHKNFFDCEISFNNPCKDLLWYIQPNLFIDGLSEFSQNTSLNFNSINNNINIISKQKFQLNQLDLLLSMVDDNYYTYLLSYKFLNNILPIGIYYHSFCLYPEETQPSGTANLRSIKGKQYSITLNDEWLSQYYKQLQTLFTEQTIIDNKYVLTLKIIGKVYDMFIVSNGRANLLFN